MARTKLIHHIVTGGTIGSKTTKRGVRDTNTEAQSKTLELLRRIPYTEYNPVKVQMSGDSSTHPRAHLVDLGRTALEHAEEGHGIIIEYGTDTMNLAAATLAIMGNERWVFPVTFLGSIKGPEKPDSDAPLNTITAGFFTRYSNTSGVCAVRPNGIIITSRHDTPGGSVDWHGRGIPQAEGAHFAKIDLKKLVDRDFNVIFDLKPKKRREIIRELEALIDIKKLREDGTLDYEDQIVVGGRGRQPNVYLLGVGRERITQLKEKLARKSTDPGVYRNEIIKREINELVAERRTAGHLKGHVIPALALIEHIRRHRAKSQHNSDSHTLHQEWEMVLRSFLSLDVPSIGGAVSYQGIEFWKRYSDRNNDDLDFTGIVTLRGSTDPNYLLQAFQQTPPRAVVLQATGASGLRLRRDFNETYEDFLTFCKESGIPVVLTSSSRGEVTSFEYEPGLELLEKDLVFFAGTLDADLVEPRLALLNHQTNRNFMESLLDRLEVTPSTRVSIKRNIQRQLLTGSHFRKPGEGETPDRQRIEDLHGIETRVDLLSGMHAKKAILAAYLNETAQRKVRVPDSVANVLIN
ncbi:MAG: asparaginase [Candidatus Woesearchaeota archaeon]|nr:MAG: asparaginase [Candidatus Woesearchaeota archaeon]